MERKPATVEQVREAQDLLKSGITHHEAKNFKEAIDAFVKCSSINPHDNNHLAELKKKVIKGGFKLIQESIAYMGCAAVHLNKLINELDSEERQQVPVDEGLQKVFQGWQ